ncbi:hypothetical protein [Aurantiacibacter flavus]|uniref:Uncharacterized protein n=1 Tax=Aurantiacibacter flavus TaxID=3145232 RepID=A0ABV0D339_9SPHN
MLTGTRQIDEPVDRAQQVIARHVVLDTEAVEQRLLHHRPLAYHQPDLRLPAKIESGLHTDRKREFFNGIRARS